MIEVENAPPLLAEDYEIASALRGAGRPTASVPEYRLVRQEDDRNAGFGSAANAAARRTELASTYPPKLIDWVRIPDARSFRDGRNRAPDRILSRRQTGTLRSGGSGPPSGLPRLSTRNPVPHNFHPREGTLLRHERRCGAPRSAANTRYGESRRGFTVDRVPPSSDPQKSVATMDKLSPPTYLERTARPAEVFGPAASAPRCTTGRLAWKGFSPQVSAVNETRKTNAQLYRLRADRRGIRDS